MQASGLGGTYCPSSNWKYQMLVGVKSGDWRGGGRGGIDGDDDGDGRISGGGDGNYNPVTTIETKLFFIIH